MSTEQQRALLPCPFCGGEAIMQEHQPHQHSDWLVKMGMPEHSTGSFTIECAKCECGMIHETRDGVVAAWNRRAALQSQDREDAERYRLLRRGQKWSVIDGIGNDLRAEELDEAIDHARRVEGEAKP